MYSNTINWPLIELYVLTLALLVKTTLKQRFTFSTFYVSEIYCIFLQIRKSYLSIYNTLNCITITIYFYPNHISLY